MKFVVISFMVLAFGFCATSCEKKTDAQNDPDVKIAAANESNVRMTQTLKFLNDRDLYIVDTANQDDTTLAGMNVDGLNQLQSLLDQYLSDADIVMRTYRINEVGYKQALQSQINGAKALRQKVLVKLHS